MSLVEKKRTEVKSLYMDVRGDRLTVEHLRAFVNALDLENVPGSTLVTCGMDHSTLRCTSLSIRVMTEEEL